MPPLDDNIEELDPSDNSADATVDATAGQNTPANDQPNTAAPSAATGENDDSELLSVVRDVVTESRKDQAASPAEGEVDGQSTADSAAKKEPDDENYSDVPFHKHPRFQQLLRKSKTYEQDAKRYQNVQGFLDNAGLNAEEAADGLTSMALMKTNPVEAWKRIKPVIQKLLVAAGEVLPEDLQTMVKEGKMDHNAALEVSRSRAAVNATHVQRSFEQQRSERRQQQDAATALSTAANDWQADRQKKDPNFDKKFVSLQKEILFLQSQEGKPNTPEAVRAQLNKAYAAVNASLKPVVVPQPRNVQRRPEIKPVTGGQVAGNTQPAPKTTLDIVRAHRRQA